MHNNIHTGIQWDLLHRPLRVFILCACLCGGLLYYSDNNVKQAEQRYQRVYQQLETLKRKYQAARQEEQLYSRYINQFRQFVARGYIVEEQRLLWVEAIQTINRTLKLPVLQYTVSPREVLVFPGNQPPLHKRLSVYESTIQLKLGLLHTGDLYIFLSELERHAKGLFEVRDCKLTLTDEAAQLVPHHANIKALCHMAWYTVEIKPQQVFGLSKK